MMRSRVILGGTIAAILLTNSGAYARKTHSAFATSFGVTLTGAEEGQVPGVLGRDYVYPKGSDAAAAQKNGLTLVRLPIRWERFQPDLALPINMVELSSVMLFLVQAANAKIGVIIELANQGRYNDAPIGSAGVPVEALGDFWKAFIQPLKKLSALKGYALMDQPKGFPDASTWATTAQLAVDAIREVDTSRSIYVQGNNGADAATWAADNANFRVKDKANNLIYEGHVNFDKDNSGQYLNSFDDEKAHAKIGVERLEPFVKWLQHNHYRGAVKGYTVPDSDSRWLDVLDNALTYLETNCLMGTYGAALKPTAGVDRIQMAILAKHKGVPNCSTNPTLPITTPTSVKIHSAVSGSLLAANGGGAAVVFGQAAAGDWNSFFLNDISGTDFNSGDFINLSAHNGQYVSVECGGGSGGLNCGAVSANRTVPGDWEQFTVTKLKGSAGDEIQRGDQISLRSFGGYFCSGDPSGGGYGTKLFCDQDKVGPGETFTITW